MRPKGNRHTISDMGVREYRRLPASYLPNGATLLVYVRSKLKILARIGWCKCYYLNCFWYPGA